ncbi:MAG: UPF0236 family protein [Bacteroidota bacterium]
MTLHRDHEFAQWPHNFKYSPLCQDRILYCGQLDVYDQASRMLKELCQIQVSDSTIQRMCVHYGDLLEQDLYDVDKRQAASTTAGPINEDTIYAQFDGGFIFSDDDWQEVKLGRVFLASDIQVVDSEDRGNVIKRSEYAASLGHFTKFTSKFSVLIEELKAPGRQLVFLTDGAIWMKKWMTKYDDSAVQILDFFHVCEHLGGFAKDVVSKIRKNHTQWYEQRKEQLKAGKYDQVVKHIKELPLRTKTAKKKRTKLLNYFSDNAYRMHYDKYLEAGYMIGSGPIEAAHRTVVQKRMKLSGQRWSDEGARPILNLRCAFKSGRQSMVRTLIKKAA